ncbi:MAG: tetratricopeptide repeat protein [Deltaproteobacteria bacterium]|nr:tetratricopeptide repeat protein [Candidatus Zymogenaceae bacterium]
MKTAEELTIHGRDFVNIGKLAKAKKLFEKAIELSPGYAEAHFQRGLIFLITRNYSTAFDNFSTAISLRPDFAEALFRRGTAYYFGSKDGGKAVADITKACELGCVPACEMLKRMRGNT